MSTRPTATIAHSTGEIRSSDSMNSAKVSCGGSRTSSSLNESRKAEKLVTASSIAANSVRWLHTQTAAPGPSAAAATSSLTQPADEKAPSASDQNEQAARSSHSPPCHPASHAHAPSTHTPRPLHTGSIAAHASRCALAFTLSDATDAAHSSAHRAAATPMRGPVRSAHRSTSAAAAASAASNSASHASRPADGAHGAAAGGDGARIKVRRTGVDRFFTSSASPPAARVTLRRDDEAAAADAPRRGLPSNVRTSSRPSSARRRRHRPCRRPCRRTR